MTSLIATRDQGKSALQYDGIQEVKSLVPSFQNDYDLDSSNEEFYGEVRTEVEVIIDVGSVRHSEKVLQKI